MELSWSRNLLKVLVVTILWFGLYVFTWAAWPYFVAIFLVPAVFAVAAYLMLTGSLWQRLAIALFIPWIAAVVMLFTVAPAMELAFLFYGIYPALSYSLCVVVLAAAIRIFGYEKKTESRE